jgi:hypothetical protein
MQTQLKLDTGFPSNDFMEFFCTWIAMDTVTEAVPTLAQSAQQTVCAFLSCLQIFPVIVLLALLK